MVVSGSIVCLLLLIQNKAEQINGYLHKYCLSNWFSQSVTTLALSDMIPISFLRKLTPRTNRVAALFIHGNFFAFIVCRLWQAIHVTLYQIFTKLRIWSLMKPKELLNSCVRSVRAYILSPPNG